MSQLVLNPFDAIGYAEALEKSGINPEAARLIAKTQAAAADSFVDSKELVTKADLRAAISELEVRLTNKLEERFTTLTTWIGGLFVAMGIGFVSVLVAIMKN